MKTYTCVICPNGCDVAVSDVDGVLSFSGALCVRGEEYARQETVDPRRTLSSLVRVEDGEREVVSVRITAPVPLARVPEVMALIRGISRTAPVARGDVLLERVLELDCRLVATDDVARKGSA